MDKKKLIIIISAAMSVLAALICVFVIIKITDKQYNTEKPDYTSSQSTTQSSTPTAITEPVVTEPDFQVYTPKKTTVSTTDSSFTFSGKAKIEAPLTLNGNPVELSADGLFSVTVDLKEGKNTFTFVHKGVSYVYTINYRFVILKEYNPSSAQSYSSGSTLAVSAKARKGSTVTATFNSQTITLKEYTAQDESASDSDVFTDYIGSFKLPSTTKNTNLGKITFKATYNGKTETFYSGNITCKKAEIKVTYDPNAAPLGNRYINVGKGKITEIIAYEAETFDAYSTNDWSRPTNNYLPKGTMDYSAQGYVYYQSGSTKKEYAVLRCGRQVYTSRKNIPTDEIVPVVKEYAGTLPDHNEIGIASFETVGNHTVLTLDTLWKAPFYFDILPQSYANPKKQDYTISNVTCNFVDITLCYTTVLQGNISIPKTNPLFSSAKIIKNKSDYTIRLYLRKQGGFYGWDANYNSKGQLVFEFLNPARVTRAQNTYGANLKGVKVLIDVGHGGKDPGAIGFNSLANSEAARNLVLAQKIKAELESIGATVYMTRTSNTTSTNDDKIKKLKQLKPDFCIAIHHDASDYSSPNGFGAFYSQPFSKKAAELVYNHTVNTGIYKKNKLAWHYYYMARSSYCPVVLTENGFITNTFDYSNIINNAANTKKARAITQGIADYFLLSSPNDVPLPEPSIPSSSTPPQESTTPPEEDIKDPSTPPPSDSSDESSSEEIQPPESNKDSSGSSSDQESDNSNSDINSDQNESSSDTSPTESQPQGTS